jgi:hypothetical protein
MLKFVACCEVAGPAASGYFADVDAPVHPHAGPISAPIPEREFVPTIGVCFHEAAHALYLHARGFRIARAQVGRRNFIERAPGEGAWMTSLQHIEAALAGDIGTGYAACRAISRMHDDEIDTASLALRQASTEAVIIVSLESSRDTSRACLIPPTTSP